MHGTENHKTIEQIQKTKLLIWYCTDPKFILGLQEFDAWSPKQFSLSSIFSVPGSWKKAGPKSIKGRSEDIDFLSCLVLCVSVCKWMLSVTMLGDQ